MIFSKYSYRYKFESIHVNQQLDSLKYIQFLTQEQKVVTCNTNTGNEILDNIV